MRGLDDFIYCLTLSYKNLLKFRSEFTLDMFSVFFFPSHNIKMITGVRLYMSRVPDLLF